MSEEILPKVGSIWAYKGDNDRLYEVMHIANIAHKNENHPTSVVYRTLRKPENIWVRTLSNFYVVFCPYNKSS